MDRPGPVEEGTVERRREWLTDARRFAELRDPWDRLATDSLFLTYFAPGNVLRLEMIRSAAAAAAELAKWEHGLQMTSSPSRVDAGGPVQLTSKFGVKLDQ